jgi:hypothetical protein
MTSAHGGGCLCGALRYEFTSPPRWVGYCHCQSCRRNTGAPIAAFVGLLHGQFRYVKGKPVRFESSPQTFRSFCGKCGSPITYESSRWADEAHINMGTLDRPQDFQPTFHVHVAEQIPWLHMGDDLPRFPESGSSGAQPLDPAKKKA